MIIDNYYIKFPLYQVFETDKQSEDKFKKGCHPTRTIQETTKNMPSIKNISLENLEEELRFHQKVVRIIGDLSTYLVFSSNFDKASKYFINEIGSLYKKFMVECAVICLFDEPVNESFKIFEWHSNRRINSEKTKKKFPIEDLTWIYSTLKEGKELFLHKEYKFPENAISETSFIQNSKIETLLALPIFTPEYIAGTVIFINFTSFYNWTEKDIRTLRVFADILGTAIFRKKTEATLAKSRDFLQKEVERKTKDLKAEKKRIELILNAIDDGIIVVDDTGKIIMVNEIAKTFFKKVINKKIYEGVNLILSEGSMVLNTIRKLVLSYEPMEVTLEPMPGFHLQFVSVGGKYPEFDSLGTIIEIRDVSPFIEFDNMRKRFISTVSHELRTPISVIDQSMKNFEKYGYKLPQVTKERLLSAISRNARLLKEIIEDLLVVSRIDERRIKLNWQEYDVKEVLSDVFKQLEPTSKEKNITLSTSINLKKFLYGDPKRVAQIFRIILDNSLKYSGENTEINIKCFDEYQGKFNPKKKNGVLIQCTDNGIGIRETEIPKLFTRFYRSTDVNHIPGTGLGLGIAKDLVKMHEGEIFIESEFRKGTKVILFLPRLEKRGR